MLLQHWFVELQGSRKAHLDVDSRRVLFHSMARKLQKMVGWDLKDGAALKDLQLIGGAFVREKRVEQHKTKRKKAAQLSLEEEEQVHQSRVLLPVNGLSLNYALFFSLSVGWGCRGGVLAYVNPPNLLIEKHSGHSSFYVHAQRQ